MAQGLTDAILGGWVTGAQSIAETLPLGISYGSGTIPPVPPAPPSPPSGDWLYPDPDDEPLIRLPLIDRAVKHLAEREIVSADEFYRLSGAAKQQAFTISADVTEDTIAKVRNLLQDNLDEGASLKTFAKAVNEALPTLPISDSHLELVFRNNAQEAFAQGQEHVLDNPIVQDGFPYRAYYAIRDARARHEHLALEHLGLDGTNVYHRDDPTWRRFRPPWAHNCRCGWAPLSVRDAAKLGVKEAQQWLDSGVEPAHAWVASPPFSPPAGWERLPVMA